MPPFDGKPVIRGNPVTADNAYVSHPLLRQNSGQILTAAFFFLLPFFLRNHGKRKRIFHGGKNTIRFPLFNGMQFLNLPEQADIAVQKMQNGEFNSIGKISVDGNAQRFGVFPQIRSSFTGTARLQKVENTVNPVRLLFKAVHPVTNAGNNSLPESPAVCLQLLAVGKRFRRNYSRKTSYLFSEVRFQFPEIFIPEKW